MLRVLSTLVLCSIAISHVGSRCIQAEDGDEISVSPSEIQLRGDWQRSSLLITGKAADGRLVDLTQRAAYRSESPAVATVNETGIVLPRADGTTRIVITVDDQTEIVSVIVRGMTEPRRFHFENDIVPLLGKFGCNASGCHGKAEGQNGFKLSVIGSDPAEDFQRLTRESRGRRLFPSAPERSLLLAKASGQIPHGGGIRIPRDSTEYRTLLAWIAAGTPFGDSEAPQIVELRVDPAERQLAKWSQQRLRVTAVHAGGEELDVTHLSRFQSNNPSICSVDAQGICTTGETPGDGVIMAGYLGSVGIFRCIVPQDGAEATSPPQLNFIDELVDRKLGKLRISASPRCSDADYLRRIYLDTIGTLPTPAEARIFLADSHPEKRARLMNELFNRPEFAEYWALKWADVLRVDRRKLGHAGAYEYYRWIRESLAANEPYDRFARELIAAEGPLNEAPAGYFYKAVTDPGEMAATLCQSLLGIRIECAQCHHHPYDRWGQTDYCGMQAFFTQVGFKTGATGDLLIAKPAAGVIHPRTGLPVPAHALGEPLSENLSSGDRRRELANWMTSAKNQWFAQNLVNRVWAHFLGRGLIDPVDDVRLTNPPSNPELLSALAIRFQTAGYDVRELIRTIAASRVYQSSSTPNPSNERDEQNFSRATFKRIDAEVLSDAISQITGVSEKFPGVPLGTRAIQLWDNEVPHYFLRTFGRPERTTPCTCERTVEPNVAQVLHLLNAPQIQSKLAHDAGRLAKLSREMTSDVLLVEELYLSIYARYPDERERTVAKDHVRSRGSERRQAVEDLAWSLMNTTEFLFNH